MKVSDNDINGEDIMGKIQKNLFAPARAFKRIFFGSKSGVGHGEQAIVLERLNDQMQDSREKILGGEPESSHS
jgi:hypothetical protein